MSLWFAQRFCAEGLGSVKPILWTGMAGLALNALLDWLLLFGHWGLPALGVPGCGIATSIATLVMAAILAWQFDGLMPVDDDTSGTKYEAEESGDIHELLRLGVPIGLILLAEAGLFAVSALLMGHFGDIAVASYQVAINFASLAFMIPLGIGLATTVRVGYASGADDLGAARFRGQVGMAMGLLNAASNATIMATLPSVIAHLYTSDETIAAHVRTFLLLAALFQFFDGLQVTANGALRGLKDTRVPMLVTLVAYWLVGMPVAWMLSFHTSAGPNGLWWGMVAGLGTAALGLSMRFASRTQMHISFES
jgi:MATE family multidrug resistance protein